MNNRTVGRKLQHFYPSASKHHNKNSTVPLQGSNYDKNNNRFPILPPISDVKRERNQDLLNQQVRDSLKNVPPQKMEHLRSIFERLDKNNSGHITKQELLDAFLLYGIFILGRTMNELTERFKVDGGDQVINHKQLWKYLAECHPTYGTFGQPEGTKEKPKEKLSGFSASYPPPNGHLGPSILSDRSGAKLSVELEMQLAKHQNGVDHLRKLRTSCQNCDLGNSGVIGIKEMEILCKHYNLHDIISSSLLEKVLNQFDVKRDGFVCWKEFLRFIEKATLPVPVGGTASKVNRQVVLARDRKNIGSIRSSKQTQTDSGPQPVRLNIRGGQLNLYPPDNLAGICTPSSDPPSESLELEWVYGYRGRDCRKNLYVLNSGEVIYFIAAVVVIYDHRSHKQRHYTEHSDDIQSLALHPDGVTVATGQVVGHEKIEGQPHIRIWSSSTLETIAIVGLSAFERAINSLAFSNTHGMNPGHLLVSLEDNDYHTITVWEWAKNKKLASTRGHMDQVITVTFVPYSDNMLISCGKQHVSFWSLEDRRLTCTRGRFDNHLRPKFITCLTFSQAGDVITGDTNGTLYVWPDGSNQIADAVRNAHDGPVFALYTLPNGYVLSAGGRDGTVLAWDRRFQPTGIRLKLIPSLPGIRSLAVHSDTLYLGTVSNDLWKTTLSQGDSPLKEAHKGLRVLGEGHSEELRGLASHPASVSFATCGSDKIVRLWDASSHRVTWSATIPVPGWSVDISSNGNLVAVGCKDGSWLLLDCSNGVIKLQKKCSSEKISDIKFSPDCLSVAVASHDNKIYVFKILPDGSSAELSGTCKGHTSYVTHVDWSQDGQTMQSTSGDYELLYWDFVNCEQITSSEDMRNTEWASQNCILGHSVMGIWPQGADGTDINFVDRSNSKCLLVTGDDFGDVNLFRYPRTHRKAERKVAKGHSAHVTGVKFLYDDSRVISVGGRDASIMQWRVA